VTGVYILVSVTAMAVALRSSPGRAAVWWLLGVGFWTFVEYMVHRFILHGVFPDGPGLRHALHLLFDHLHVEHHSAQTGTTSTADRDTAPSLLPAFLLGACAAAHPSWHSSAASCRVTWRRR
jgi:hypothetical protein